jgi:type II secretory pathway pseudopilin PulG
MPEFIPAPTPQDTREGFSLVELLVALVFMALLMAGMAKVFQSSMNTFYRSSESISSGRRNRMAMDLLYDDLDAAGQYLTNLTAYPSYSTNNPGFYILPNQPYTGTDVPTAQATTDELTFSFDEALPFEGRLYDPVKGVLSTSFAAQSNASRLAKGVDVAAGTLDTTMYVKFTDAAYASMVKDGMTVVFKDQWGPMKITGTTILGSDPTAVSFKTDGGSDDAMGLPTGVNPLNDAAHFVGDGSLNPATGGAPVLFVQPKQGAVPHQGRESGSRESDRGCPLSRPPAGGLRPGRLCLHHGIHHRGGRDRLQSLPERLPGSWRGPSQDLGGMGAHGQRFRQRLDQRHPGSSQYPACVTAVALLPGYQRSQLVPEHAAPREGGSHNAEYRQARREFGHRNHRRLSATHPDSVHVAAVLRPVLQLIARRTP